MLTLLRPARSRGTFSLGRRLLHVFSPTRPELVLANNSGLFFTHASVEAHGIKAHPELSVVVPPFWLDSAHSDYDQLDWGQTPIGLPRHVRDRFNDIYPNHHDDELISWGQFKNLRQFVLDELRRKGVPVYTGMPTIERVGRQYQIMTDSGVDLSMPDDTYFYNSFRVPKTKLDFPATGAAPSHTTLYTLARQEVPKRIILVGGGRSAIWTAQHFSEHFVACIRYAKRKLPWSKNEPRAVNLVEYFEEQFEKEERTVAATPFKLLPLLNGEEHAIVCDTDARLNFSGRLYCSGGLIRRNDLTDSVAPGNVRCYPDSLEGVNWVHTEETPIGSLIESHLRWAHLTGNLSWAAEPGCYHEPFFPEVLAGIMARRGIELNGEFFDCLRMRIEAINDGLVPVRKPNDEQMIEIYTKSYCEAMGRGRSAELQVLVEEIRRLQVGAVEEEIRTLLPTTW